VAIRSKKENENILLKLIKSPSVWGMGNLKKKVKRILRQTLYCRLGNKKHCSVPVFYHAVALTQMKNIHMTLCDIHYHSMLWEADSNYKAFINALEAWMREVPVCIFMRK
jgi:hypothetical protein